MANTMSCDRCHAVAKTTELEGWRKVSISFDGSDGDAVLDLDPRCVDIVRNAIKPLTKTARTPKIAAGDTPAVVDPGAGLV